MRGMAREYAAGNARGPGWREFAGTLGQLQAGRQAGSGMARSRAKARVNWDSQGQRRGRCRVRRRAERVIRPTRAKTRRLRVLVVTVRSLSKLSDSVRLSVKGKCHPGRLPC